MSSLCTVALRRHVAFSTPNPFTETRPDDPFKCMSRHFKRRFCTQKRGSGLNATVPGDDSSFKQPYTRSLNAVVPLNVSWARFYFACGGVKTSRTTPSAARARSDCFTTAMDRPIDSGVTAQIIAIGGLNFTKSTAAADRTTRAVTHTASRR
jgi:hypothetical protein